MSDEIEFSALDDPMPPFADRGKMDAAMTRGRVLRRRRRTAWVAGMTTAVLVSAGGALAVTATKTATRGGGDSLDVPPAGASATPSTPAHHKARPKHSPTPSTVALGPGPVTKHRSSGTAADPCTTPTAAPPPVESPPPTDQPSGSASPTAPSDGGTPPASPPPSPASGTPAAGPATGNCGPTPASSDEPDATPTSTDASTPEATQTP